MPPALRVRARAPHLRRDHGTAAAVADGAVRHHLGDRDAGCLQALGAVDHRHGVGPGGGVVLDEDLVGEQAARIDGIGAGAADHGGAVGQVDRDRGRRRAGGHLGVHEGGGVVELVRLRDGVVGIDDGGVRDGADGGGRGRVDGDAGVGALVRRRRPCR